MTDNAETLRRARFVADYWRWHLYHSERPWDAHPLCMVLAALDGETNPIECGVAPDAADQFAVSDRYES